MKRRNRNQLNIDKGLLEVLYFGAVTLLCVISLLRGCAARSAEVATASVETGTENSGGSVASGPDSSSPEGAENGLFYSAGRGVRDYTGTDASVRKNTFDPARFGYVSDTSENITYYDDNFVALQGIDVSEHQGDIDWKKVAEAGYEFVFVRLGFRGYGEEGTLNEDTRAIEYLRGAENAGMQVGAYFFSQAVTEEEAEEEAEFAVGILERSGVKLDLPLVYDPEFIPGVNGRANHVTREQVCLNTDAFRDTVEAAIHCKVALYANLYWENNMFDAETLNEYEIWYADYLDAPETPYHFTWWQYSETGTVPGIKGAMDLNLWIRRMD